MEKTRVESMEWEVKHHGWLAAALQKGLYFLPGFSFEKYSRADVARDFGVPVGDLVMVSVSQGGRIPSSMKKYLAAGVPTIVEGVPATIEEETCAEILPRHSVVEHTAGESLEEKPPSKQDESEEIAASETVQVEKEVEMLPPKSLTKIKSRDWVVPKAVRGWFFQYGGVVYFYAWPGSAPTRRILDAAGLVTTYYPEMIYVQEEQRVPMELHKFLPDSSS